MKPLPFQKCVWGTAITVLCWIGIPSPLSSQAQTPAPPTPTPTAGPAGSSELPAYIYPSSPLAQVVRLTQAGVDQSVIMTFVTNSSSTFNLDSDKIIYLRDVGLPNDAITAMMQRDLVLHAQMVAANQPAPQPETAPSPTTTEQPETAPAPPPTEAPAPVTVNYFYDSLAPYGSWVDVDGFGRCWRPSVVAYTPGWQPYCDHGRWVYTDCGWYWYSDYSWGWAPFHYGRWFQSPNLGWCWAPDTVWGPSWVTWRYSNNYCGWAPLPPTAVYQSGVGFFYQGHNVSFGFGFGLGSSCFTFVPTQNFCDPHPRRFCATPAQVSQFFNQTTVINNFNVRNRNFVNGGIAPEHITAATRMPIHPVAIQNAVLPPGHGPRSDQLSHDGRVLIASRPDFAYHPSPGGNQNHRPPQGGSPNQIHSPQPNHNWATTPPQPSGQPQVPIATTHNLQQPNNRYLPNQNQIQRPSSSAYYSPPPAAATPNYIPNNNRNYTPRAREQFPSAGMRQNNPQNAAAPVATPVPGQGQHNAPMTSYHSAPAAAPAATPQPVSPAPAQFNSPHR